MVYKWYKSVVLFLLLLMKRKSKLSEIEQDNKEE